jgi:hypothetical protein
MRTREEKYQERLILQGINNWCNLISNGGRILHVPSSKPVRASNRSSHTVERQSVRASNRNSHTVERQPLFYPATDTTQIHWPIHTALAVHTRRTAS